MCALSCRHTGPTPYSLAPETRARCVLVVRAVAADTGISYADFFAPTRLNMRVSRARQIAMYMCHTLLSVTLTQVGQFFGRDRKTVAHACALVEDARDEMPDCAQIDRIEAVILAADLAGQAPHLERISHVHG